MTRRPVGGLLSQHDEICHDRHSDRPDSEVLSRELCFPNKVESPENDAGEHQRQHQVEDEQHSDVPVGSHVEAVRRPTT